MIGTVKVGERVNVRSENQESNTESDLEGMGSSKSVSQTRWEANEVDRDWQ